MKKALLISLSLCIAAGAALASPQTEKMKTCNADAKTKALKGDERKKFMSDCLSAGGGGDAKSSQQDKMKTCNADAKTKALKGDERKKFMSDCLKG